MTKERTRWGSAALLAVGVAITAMSVACDDGGNDEASAEEIASVEATVRDVVSSDGSNADFFFAHVTDNLIESALFSTREECAANAVECIGEPLPVEGLSDTEIDGDTARSIVDAGFATLQLALVREDGVWKVDDLQAAPDDVRVETTVVDVDLQEFALVFDPGDVPEGGDMAFRATNVGGQMHEIVVLRVPEGGELEDAIASVESEESPPLGAKIYIRPGQQVDMAFDAPLEPGKYAMVCFFPDTDDPEFTAHVEKGMFAEFTIE